MISKEASIVFVGAGAIGGITAAFIKKAGWDPIIVCKHQNAADLSMSPGVHITGIKGDHTISLKAVKNISDLSGRQDLIFLATKGKSADLKRYLTIRIIGFKYRRIKSSSLQSLERGRRTEIDYLNGYICGKGKTLGVPTPLNNKVKAMVLEIENGQRPMSLDNLDEFAN